MPPPGDDEFLQYHLAYEITMLRDTYQRWPHADGVINNALIESFCVHARNLMEFFEKRARTYTEPEYQPYAANNISRKQRERFERRINEQISHLRDGRTANDEQKIDQQERTKILNMLSVEITGFKENVARQFTHINIPQLAPVPSEYDACSVGQHRAPSTTTVTATTYTHMILPRRAR